MARLFEDPALQWVIGNVANLFADAEVTFRKSPPICYRSLLADPDRVRQQATFFRRDALTEAGGWNAGFHMVMDYDLWVRLARRSAPVMADENWAYYRNHGAQKSCHANILRQSAEISAILAREGAPWRQIARQRSRKRWYWLKGVLKGALIRLGVLPARFQNRPLRLDRE